MPARAEMPFSETGGIQVAQIRRRSAITTPAEGPEEGADLRLVQKASTHWVDADIKRACASMLFLKFAEACAPG
jgi:hypothetical protein